MKFAFYYPQSAFGIQLAPWHKAGSSQKLRHEPKELGAHIFVTLVNSQVVHQTCDWMQLTCQQ